MHVHAPPSGVLPLPDGYNVQKLKQLLETARLYERHLGNVLLDLEILLREIEDQWKRGNTV